MDETLKQKNPPSDIKLSDEGGIRPRLRDRDMLKKRKAETEEKATYQWVYGTQSLKQAKKRSSGTPGRKGRPRKQQPIDFSVAQEDSTPVTLPELSTAADPVTLQLAEPQPLSVETISEKPLETFLIEDLRPDEEGDMPSPEKSLVIDTGDDEQRCADPLEQGHISMPAFPQDSVSSYPESPPEPLI